ncbi:MAG: hypothetical protein AAGG69_09385 [Pseudomonadota bacterium]
MKQRLEVQQQNFLRSAVTGLFFAALALNGADIKIPFIDATIGQIPYIMQGSLVIAAVGLAFAPFAFVSIQIYDGLIDVTAKRIGKGLIDPVPIVASLKPMWLVFNFGNPIPVAGTERGLKVKRAGRLALSLMTILIALFIIALLIFLYGSLIYLAYAQFTWLFANALAAAIVAISAIIAATTILATFARFDYEITAGQVAE